MNEPGWSPSPALTAEWPRPRVSDALLRALSQPLVLLCAAAGYGKTVAGHQVWHAWQGHKAWWTVRTEDQKPEHGIASLVAAARQGWGLPPGDLAPAALLAELPQAAGGLLIIDDISAWPSPALWGAIGQLVAGMTPGCHLLFLCRYAPPLPVTLWRSQGRLHWFDHSLLRLNAEEWQMAGFADGDDSCTAACGWWGAQAAASAAPGSSNWNPSLAAWLDEAWFAQLPKEQQTVLGLASLLPDVSIDELAALSGQAAAQTWAAWAVLDAHPGPIFKKADRLGLAPLYRLYTSQAWRRHDSEAWARAIGRGCDFLLQRGDNARVALLAYESGLAELQDKVIGSIGWSLLYGRERPLLDQLLQQNPSPSLQSRVLQCAWQIEVEKAPHRAEASLLGLLPQLAGDLRAQAQALLATMNWQYDNFDEGERWAVQALNNFSSNLHPVYAVALLGQANTLFGQGQPKAAEALMRRAAAHAARDELPLLQLEILQRRALLASETGDLAGAMVLITETRTLALSLAPGTVRVLDSSARLSAWLHLYKLELDAAQQALHAAASADDGEGSYWSFPQRLLHAMFALATNDFVTARTEVDWLSQRLSEQFHCHKWQNEATLAQLWLAAQQLDRPRLLQLEQSLSLCDWKPGLHRDRRRILLAAVRLLGDLADDGAELQTLLQRLHDSGARTLASTLALTLALGQQDREALIQCIRQDALAARRLDYLWLGNKSIGPLEKLLSAPELIHDPVALQFLRGIVQKLLAPRGNNGEHAGTSAQAPAGLTSKEWQILQLIGQQLTNEQIAARLFVSMATVKTHINHLYGKLDIKTRAEAVHRARSLGC